MRVTSSRFVGRASELAEFEAALREAAAGSPSVVALCGDSGVGKTRLIGEFEASAGEQARFLRGECVELDDGELPYAPLIGALRELSRSGDEALERLAAPTREALAALLPGLGEVSHDERDDESAQLRLFEALLELLELLGRERPVVLVIEDLHWADRSTRAFTAFLARGLRGERVLFVVSYRSDELHRRHPLLPLMGELDRGEGTRRIAIAPWAPEELGQALADILGAAPREDLLARLFARAEGNPLYTEELLAAGLDGRGAAPQSLRDAFMLRLERLSAEAQRMLRVLAVARRADEELLAEVGGFETEALRDALREAVSGHVVEVGGDGRFLFRHALLREVAYEDLLPGERTALHLAIANVLERRRAEGDPESSLAAQVAAHAYAAGDRSLTLCTAIAAATQASSIHAHGEAAGLLERALECWPRVADAHAISGLDHVELLLAAAEEQHHDEQPGRAQTLLEQALSELDERTEPVRAALVLDRLARVQWELARGDDALRLNRRALELLPAGRADTQRAAVLAWGARTTSLRGRYREALAAAREALALIRAIGAGPRLESQVLNTLGMAVAGSGEREAGIAELRGALELAQRTADPVGVAVGHTNLADLLLTRGRTCEALAVALDGLERVPPSLRGHHLWLAATVAEAAIASGDWQLAARSLDRVDRAAEGRWLMNLRMRRAELALGTGEHERAARSLQEIETLVTRTLEPQFHASYGLALADLHRRCGRLELARGAIEQALDRIEFCTEDSMRVTAIAAAGLAVEADIAQRARDQGDTAALSQAELCAELHLARVQGAAQSAGPVEHAWELIAEAELGRLRGHEDPSVWARAAAAWEEIERPYPAARAHHRRAEALLEAGDRAGAAQALGTARAVAAEIGAGWLVQELEGLAARARLTLAALEAGAAEPDPAEDPFGLTPREREVLMLVARGATNREIGAELFMAEKTASVHVSRILAKLDVRTRTQAAAVAHRAGLVSG
jgi:ATP/maltotriose-dependent transcriptional regulator MalT